MNTGVPFYAPLLVLGGYCVAGAVVIVIALRYGWEPAVLALAASGATRLAGVMVGRYVTIDAHKTLSEIQRLLATHGARGVLVEYDGAGNPVSLAFQIGVDSQMLRYRLPCRHQAVLRQLQKDARTSRAQRTEAQALRVAWRILRDWIEAQLAIVEAQMVEMGEVFMPYALTDDGRTMYERSADVRLLPGPTDAG